MADSTNGLFLWGDDFEAILDGLEDTEEVEEQCAVIVRIVSWKVCPIAQWLESPVGILEGHGFDSRWGSENSFFWVFRLENPSPFFNQMIFIVQFVISKH